MQRTEIVIVGQGLAGTALAWHCYWQKIPFLMVDAEEATTSSKIAAGLITPITGQRLVQSWRFAELWPYAHGFYRRVEEQLQIQCLTCRPMVRFLQNAVEQDRYLSRRTSAYQSWMRPPVPEIPDAIVPSPFGCFEMPRAAQLDTMEYLSASKAFFVQLGCYQTGRITPKELLYLPDGLVEIPQINWCSHRVLFARGHQDRDAFQLTKWRWNPAKGEILEVSIPDYHEMRPMNFGIWLAATAHGSYRLGSTYDWDQLDTTPTENGKQKLLQEFAKWFRLPIQVIDHQAAVRPVIDAGKPLLGYLPWQPQIGFLNGLGSKGSLLAPFFALQLIQNRIDPEVDLAKIVVPL